MAPWSKLPASQGVPVWRQPINRGSRVNRIALIGAVAALVAAAPSAAQAAVSCGGGGAHHYYNMRGYRIQPVTVPSSDNGKPETYKTCAIVEAVTAAQFPHYWSLPNWKHTIAVHFIEGVDNSTAYIGTWHFTWTKRENSPAPGEWSAQFRATKGSQLVTFLVTSAKTSIPPGY